jgi:putative PEP-CTERM system TPR-repeat lipoprotein
MKPVSAVRATLLSVAISLVLVGCGGEGSTEMSPEEIKYISHLDQSRFFQRQGELKASTLEARSAVELQPNNAEPYFIIIDNLLTAGDAVNAERQVNFLKEHIAPEALDDTTLNKIKLIRAESEHIKGEHDQVLDILDDLQNPDRPQQIQANLLRADTLKAKKQLDEAEQFYKKAQELDTSSVQPIVGLSQVAYAKGNEQEAVDFIKQAEEIDPNSPELWLWKARFAQAKQNWQEAEDAYIRALEDIGQYDIMTYKKYETISSLIRVLREQGKAAEAFVYEEMLAKSAPGTIRSNLEAAQDAYEQGNLEESARYLEEVLKQSPLHQQSALLLGMIRFRQGRMDEAERLLTPLADNEDTEVAAKLLAATKIQLRNLDDAREILDSLSDKETDPAVLAMIGITTLAGGENEAGEQLIEKSLELKPDNNELRIRFARYLIQQNKTDRALAQLKEVIKHNPDSIAARQLIVEAYFKADNQSAAINYADEWLEQKPESTEAMLVRGQLALAQDNVKLAYDLFSRAADNSPQDAAPLLTLGAIERSRGNSEKASEFFKQAVTLAPNNLQALQSFSRALPQEQVTVFLQKLVEQNPEAPGPRLVLLEQALLNGDTQTSTEHLAVLLEPIDENTPSRLTNLVASIFSNVATQKINEDKMEEARKTLDRARELFPESERIALQAANLAYQTDQKDTANKILREAKLNHPDSARPFLTEASWMSADQRHREAAELYQLALEKQQNAATELRYAQELQKAGQTTKAIEAMETAQSQYPDNHQITFALALAYQQAGLSGEAAKAYETVIQSQPTNVIALNNLAWLYQQQENPRALEVAKQAYELGNKSAAVADTFGWIMFKQGQHEESIPILEKAHAANPESSEIGLHLAEAYKAIGEQDKAKAILEKFQQ